MAKGKKAPYNPAYHFRRGSVKRPQSWGSLHEAFQALETGNYSGLGLIITPPLVFIDLDHCFDSETPTIIDPKAAEIVRQINSSTEISPSGTGLHILTFGRMPGRNLHTQIEMYGQDRFTTITTNHLTETPTTIEYRETALVAVYQQFRLPVVRNPPMKR